MLATLKMAPLQTEENEEEKLVSVHRAGSRANKSEVDELERGKNVPDDGSESLARKSTLEVKPDADGGVTSKLKQPKIKAKDKSEMVISDVKALIEDLKTPI